MRPKILLIDNYDSFTYNLVQAFLVLGAEVDVHRNDAISVDEALALEPIAPGHFTGTGHAARRGHLHADDSGLCRAHPDIRRLSRPSILVEVFGGKVVRAARLMHGKVSPVLHDGKGLYAGMPPKFDAGRYHSLIAAAGQHPGRARSHGADRGGRNHGRAAPISAHRRRAISPGKRADAGRSAFSWAISSRAEVNNPRDTLDQLWRSAAISPKPRRGASATADDGGACARDGRRTAGGTARQGRHGRRSAWFRRRHARAGAQARAARRAWMPSTSSAPAATPRAA